MAKKTIKVGLKTAGTEPAAGDVNISYKGSRIAGLSESSTAVLETENTIVQDDIEVEYTKPAGGSDFPTLTINDTSVGIDLSYKIDGALYKSGDNWILSNSPPLGATHYIPSFGFDVYNLSGEILCDNDSLNVKVNGSDVEYDTYSNSYSLRSVRWSDYMTNVVITVTNKDGEQ